MFLLFTYGGEPPAMRQYIRRRIKVRKWKKISKEEEDLIDTLIFKHSGEIIDLLDVSLSNEGSKELLERIINLPRITSLSVSGKSRFTSLHHFPRWMNLRAIFLNSVDWRNTTLPYRFARIINTSKRFELMFIRNIEFDGNLIPLFSSALNSRKFNLISVSFRRSLFLGILFGLRTSNERVFEDVLGSLNTIKEDQFADVRVLLRAILSHLNTRGSYDFFRDLLGKVFDWKGEMFMYYGNARSSW